MTSVDYMLDVFRSHARKDAIVWRDQRFSYRWLHETTAEWMDRLTAHAVAPGSVVSLEADFSPNAIALLLALIAHRCVVVPLTTAVGSKKGEFREIAHVEVVIDLGDDDRAEIRHTSVVATHELLRKLKQDGDPGLVLFSSGSTGKSKAAVHDFVPLLEKFKVSRRSLRTLSFLLFDHIGGINTLLYTLSNAGGLVTVQDRSPDAVCEAIERYEVQLLPTSPTFINLILLSDAYKRHDLRSLEMVTYGTEAMPETTLVRFHALFPQIQLLQTYGLSELGILRSKSKASDSLWVKIGGEGFQTRIVDGMLQIKAQSAMLGYLNAPSPFTADGWFATGDVVEIEGEYLRILGRKSEVINVGGEKVYPAEVEGTLQLMEGVEDVMVSAERNPITGQIVHARVKLKTGETASEFGKRMRLFCRDKLPTFKVPQKVVVVGEAMHGERFKKMRREVSA
jgi:acyl-coenzyme A synthetase/AMP-(fatty) acid ligase